MHCRFFFAIVTIFFCAAVAQDEYFCREFGDSFSVVEPVSDVSCYVQWKREYTALEALDNAPGYSTVRNGKDSVVVFAEDDGTDFPRDSEKQPIGLFVECDGDELVVEQWGVFGHDIPTMWNRQLIFRDTYTCKDWAETGNEKSCKATALKGTLSCGNVNAINVTTEGEEDYIVLEEEGIEANFTVQLTNAPRTPVTVVPQITSDLVVEPLSHTILPEDFDVPVLFSVSAPYTGLGERLVSMGIAASIDSDADFAGRMEIVSVYIMD